MEEAQRAVAFVAFGNEIFASLIPKRVRSENWNFSAHIVRRVQSPFAQYVRRHCGSSCFAVHSGNHNAALGSHNGSDGFRATVQRLSAITRRYENSIVLL